jgi:hypothetical protein
MTDLKPQASSGSSSNGAASPPLSPDDALAGLRKMSTTAGLGSGDYVAINTLAIASTLLGLGSVVVPLLNYDLLQVIPLAALVTAVVAWQQIQGSNGTQTGKGLAAAGMALALLIGGGTLVAKGYTAWKYAPETRDISGMIQDLGSEIAQANAASPPATSPAAPAPASRPSDAMVQMSRHYRNAYRMFSDKFRGRVSDQQFADVWSQVNRGAAGGVQSMQWNGLIDFTTDTGSGAPKAGVMALLRLNNSREVLREGMLFTKEAGKWEIDDMPNLFAEAKARKPGQ